MSGTHAHLRLIPYTQFEQTSTSVALSVTADGVWRNAGIFVDLPGPGIYYLGHDLRTNMTTAGNGNNHILSRLWDNTAGAAVSGSGRLVQQHDTQLSAGDQTVQQGGNNTASAQVLYTVDEPRRIYSQAAYFHTSGAAPTLANIITASIAAYTVRG
jgi:hypothetical protein